MKVESITFFVLSFSCLIMPGFSIEKCSDDITYCKPLNIPGGDLQEGPTCSQGSVSWDQGGCEAEAPVNQSTENKCTQTSEQKFVSTSYFTVARNANGSYYCRADGGRTTQATVICAKLEECQPKPPQE